MGLRNLQLVPLLFFLLLSGCFRLPAAIELREESGEVRWFPSEIWVRTNFRVELEVVHSAGKGQHLFLLTLPGKEREALLEGASPVQVSKGSSLPSAVILKSRVLNPGELEKIHFVAPEKVGLYPILCGIPGHENERAILRVSER